MSHEQPRVSTTPSEMTPELGSFTPTDDEREASRRAWGEFQLTEDYDLIPTHCAGYTMAAFRAGFTAALRAAGVVSVQGEPSAQARDRDGICRRCGLGLTAAELLDGERPCDPQGEPEWEYGLLNPETPDGGKLMGGAHLISDDREHIERQQRRGHPSILAVQRTKAGPWVPVQAPEGEEKP